MMKKPQGKTDGVLNCLTRLTEVLKYVASVEELADKNTVNMLGLMSLINALVQEEEAMLNSMETLFKSKEEYLSYPSAVLYFLLCK